MRSIDFRLLVIFGLTFAGAPLFGQATPPSDQATEIHGGATTSRPRPQMVVQLGHAGNVQAVAYSADGLLALTGSDDHTAKLWDTTTAREIRRFAGHTQSVTAVAFSADAQAMLTGSADGTARLWDTATAQEIRRFEHPAAVTSAVVASQGQLMATGCGDGKARLWKIQTGECVATLTGHSSVVRSVAFSSDGTQVLTGSDDQTACLWDVKSAQVIVRLSGHTAQIFSVAISPDGRSLLTGSLDATARTWQATDGSPLVVFKVQRRVFAATFSPDGRQVLTGNEGFPIRGEEPSERHHTVRLWNAATGEQLRSCRDSGSSARAVAFAPSGQQVLVGSTGNAAFFGPVDGESHIWDLATGAELRSLKGQGVAAIRCLVFSADGRWLLLGDGSGIARLWDGESGREIQRFQHPSGRIQAVAISRDGRIVVTGGEDDIVRLWDRESGAEIRRLEGHTGVIASVAISPDLRFVLSGSCDSTARMWDTSNGKELQRLAEYTGQTESSIPLCPYVAFSPDGSQLATAQWDNTARIWNVADGREVRRLEGHANRVVAVAFSSDGKRLLTGSWDQTARLWDVASGAELKALRHDGAVRSVAFSPHDRAALTASADATARLWRLDEGEELHRFPGHYATGQSVAFAAGGLMAMANLDSTATLYATNSAREICTLVSCDGGSLVVTPDGHYMAPKGALKSVAFGLENRGLPFDQFDLKFNRPDLVLSQIGLASDELIDTYRQFYEKRLRKLGFTADMLGDDFHLPEVAVLSKHTFLTAETKIQLKVRASDSLATLDRLLIDVNGVPLDGGVSVGLRKLNVKQWEQDVEIELSTGKNSIEISVLNDRGAESLHEQLEVRCEAPRRQPDLYVVAVGVSDYVDPRFRLTYAHKDAGDLAAYCQAQSKDYGKIHVQLLQNRDATRENILKTKRLLQNTHVDDQVVLFFAGHGLLDAKLDYYFATANIDFAQPARHGLSYDDLEGLLQGIRARQKLLLIDTCHSGEADKDEVQTARAETTSLGTVKARSFRDFAVINDASLAPNQSRRLVEEMFADLRRGTGAVVISAAGSAEYALESATWQNGVFTYAVLAGLRDAKADANNDGQIRVSELRDYVQQEVRRLTHGRQSPIARKENLKVDFPLR